MLDFVKNNPKGTEYPGDAIIYGDLDLTDTDIYWLIGKLVVTGNMTIRRCKLREIPRGLFVGGDLYIYIPHVLVYIPEDLNVRGDIHAENTLVRFPEDFTTNRNLYLRCSWTRPSQLRLPLHLPNMTVNGDLDTSNRIIEEWPKCLIIKGRWLHNRGDNISGIIISRLEYC